MTKKEKKKLQKLLNKKMAETEPVLYEDYDLGYWRGRRDALTEVAMVLMQTTEDTIDKLEEAEKEVDYFERLAKEYIVR